MSLGSPVGYGKFFGETKTNCDGSGESVDGVELRLLPDPIIASRIFPVEAGSRVRTKTVE